jgi:VWFA-related protein
VAIPSVRLWTACLAGALVTAAAGLVAQQPSFKASVEVVLIDVTVVDRTAFPVRDLAAADFTVTVDGKPRTILSAQFLSHRAPGIDDLLRVESGLPALAAPEPEQVGTGRDIIIAVDEDSLEAGDGQIAKRAMGRFLNQLVPADRVAIVTIPRLPSRVGLTSNRVTLFEAVDRVSPGLVLTKGRHNISLSEAFDIERLDTVTTTNVVDRECSETRIANPRELETCRLEVITESKQLANLGHDRGQRSLDSLRRLAGLLSSIPRPKTLVLVSGGFPRPVSHMEFSNVATALSAGQVNLYTLFLPRYEYSSMLGVDSPTKIDDEQLEREGIENMTASAGGTLFEVTGDFEPWFDRVAREISASYLLAVEVEPADRDGRPHRVNVKVNRDGVQIRSRRQYVIGKPLAPGPIRAEGGGTPGVGPQAGSEFDGGLGQLSYNRILTAARDLEGTGDVYLKVKASETTVAGSPSREVLVDVIIDPLSVSFSPLDGRRVARLGIAVFCGNSKNATVGELWQEMNLALKDDSYQRYKQQGIPFSAKVPVTGDARRVKVVVYDYRSDLVGAMSAKVK